MTNPSKLEHVARALIENGVDGQVLVAAADMGKEEKRNPEWLWYDHEAGGVTCGRWAALDSQVPYIRADLVITAVRAALKEEKP